MKIFSKTDIGLKRTTNQDFYDNGEFSDNAIWIVVCDGMGGANGGNIASEIAVDKTKEYLLKNYKSDIEEDDIEELLIDAVEYSNKIVFDVSEADDSLSGMGTTIVATIIKNDTAYIVHVGDSRAYLIKNDGTSQITTDHSMVQELVSLGSITKEEAKNHPQRNIITRALGVKPSVETESDIIELIFGDRLLICTDGMSNYIDEDEITELSKENTVENFAGELIEKALSAGGSDNITVVVVEV